ncbi:MAG: nitronate monooxygenase [bacterium]
MGIDVSGWELARAVALEGEIGTISGICLDTVMIRELQDGDPDNRIKALENYPDTEIVEEIIDKYYVDGGIAPEQSYKLLPVHRAKSPVWNQRVLSAATFSEVIMAKEGHEGIIAMNLMAKLKRYTLAGLYGAMLAGIDRILMGAGIPAEEAKQVIKLARGEKASLQLEVDTSALEEDRSYHYKLDPANLLDNPPEMEKPAFYPIVSSDGLARILNHRLAEEAIDGWIVERPVAGGHNAPPRNKNYDQDGTPQYDERDDADLEKMREMDRPFYLAGGYGTPEKFQEALDEGASGVQIGSLFSLAEESNYPTSVKRKLIKEIHADNVSVRTDGRISPTGFPFKVIELEGTLGIKENMKNRKRICDLGYLRELYAKENGEIGHRCAAEPVENYVRKGGTKEDTKGRGCLCNALFANIGLPQVQPWGEEGKILTAGDDLVNLSLGSEENPEYTAKDVIDYLYRGIKDA